MINITWLGQGTYMGKADHTSDSETPDTNLSLKAVSHLPTHFKIASRTAAPSHVKSPKNQTEASS